jgi:hypothetical protein
MLVDYKTIKAIRLYLYGFLGYIKNFSDSSVFNKDHLKENSE